jgi:hypothetical protein
MNETPCHVCIYFSAHFSLLPLQMLSITTRKGTLDQANRAKCVSTRAPPAHSVAGPSKRRKKKCSTGLLPYSLYKTAETQSPSTESRNCSSNHNMNQHADSKTEQPVGRLTDFLVSPSIDLLVAPSCCLRCDSCFG